MTRFSTASGRLVDINKLSSEDICLEDIAHHLAKIQRYNGASPITISYVVGEHCINLANYYEHKLYKSIAILHDASEAYLGDLISGTKTEQYKELEKKVQRVILEKYLGINVLSTIDYGVAEILVKGHDARIVLDEVKAMFPDRYKIYKKEIGLKPLNTRIFYNQHPSTVKQCFLTICKQLGIKDD